MKKSYETADKSSNNHVRKLEVFEKSLRIRKSLIKKIDKALGKRIK